MEIGVDVTYYMRVVNLISWPSSVIFVPVDWPSQILNVNNVLFRSIYAPAVVINIFSVI